MNVSVTHELTLLKPGLDALQDRQHPDRQAFVTLHLACKGESIQPIGSVLLTAHLGVSQDVAFSEVVGGDSLTCNGNVSTYPKGS